MKKPPKKKPLAKKAPEKDPAPPRHCDEYIDDPTAPACLRRFLERARAPAHGMLIKEPFPQLYADHEGLRVRVTMASRFGHVGVTTDLGRGTGYDRTAAVEQLSNFAETP